MLYEIKVTGTLENKAKADALAALLKVEGFEVSVTELMPAPAPAPVPEPAPAPAPAPNLDDIARAVINGDYGNGHATREANLQAAGMLEHYSYQQIRNRVNELYRGVKEQ